MTNSKIKVPGVPETELNTLERYGFDETTFYRLQKELREGLFTPERNFVKGEIKIPTQKDLISWPKSGSPEYERFFKQGTDAIKNGEVGAVILNGGMATRFGGVVKGTVEVTDNKSFLALKLADIYRQNPKCPVFIMNSFATAESTIQHLAALPDDEKPEKLHFLTQHISLRLTPEGDVATKSDGRPDYYAPGHGDVFPVLAESEAIREFRENGGKYLLVSNVDNLAATLSPIVIGAHIDAGQKITFEMAPRAEGDKGGAPARLNDHLEIVEGFRFPADFDIAQIPVFNTNTMIINLEATTTDYPLTWYRADKKSEGKDVVQFERLMGEVTAFVDSAFLEVPREGADGRFLPVKTPDDLKILEPVIRKLFNL